MESPNGAWGSSNPLVMVLGFSRGVRQSKPDPFDEIAFRGMRKQLSSILHALRLLRSGDDISKRINRTEIDFHFGSLFRCSVAMWNKKKNDYSKSGSGILERFLADPTARPVAENCTSQFLSILPSRTKLIVLLGNTSDYVEGCRMLFQRLHPGIRPINEVAYGTNDVVWVHTIHAAAQGSYIPQWIEGRNTTIGRKLNPARDAVALSGVLPLLAA